jgi:hypothetical protein
MNDLEARIRNALQEDASRAPHVVRMPERVRARVRRRQAATTVLASMIAIAVIAGSVFVFRTVSEPTAQPANQPTTSTVPSAWSGPVREGGALAVHRASTWGDPQDAPMGWIDITRVGFRMQFGQPTWDIGLGAQRPLEAGEPGILKAYGLVLETTGDGVADYVVGIDNDAPEQGDLHAWVTNLATGETDEQIGPPYGSPFDFAGPGRGGWSLFFLPGTAPEDFNPKTMRFYAWASATRDGEVFAWDYAPDTGWITKP